MATRDRAAVFTGDDGITIEWLGLLNGDDGAYYVMPPGYDWSVGAFGTWGVGGTVTLEQSNESGTPTSPQPCHDVLNVAATLTDAAGNRHKQLLDTARQFRPRVSAGDGATALTVRLVGRRP
jgi:hypothetical protein